MRIAICDDYMEHARDIEEKKEVETKIEIVYF